MQRVPVISLENQTRSLVRRLGLDHPLLALACLTIKHWYRKLVQAPSLTEEDVLHDRWLFLRQSKDIPVWLWFCIQKVTAHKRCMDEATALKRILPIEDEALATQRYSALMERVEDELPTHTMEDEFFCEFCDRSFRTTVGLRVHINKIHGEKDPQIGPKQSSGTRGVDGMPICSQMRLSVQRLVGA